MAVFNAILASYNTYMILFSGVIIKEINDFDSAEFDQSIKIYESSFPAYEIRPAKTVVEMLRNNLNYHLYASLDNHSVVGISLLYTFYSLNIGLLYYIAVIPSYQQQGIGNDLFAFTLEKFNSSINKGVGLLMEVQREDDPKLEEQITRKNRIRFYMKLGGKILEGVRYLLPPLQNGTDPEEMYLMIRPLKRIHFLSKDWGIEYHFIYRLIIKKVWQIT